MLLADLAVSVAAGLGWLDPEPGRDGLAMSTVQRPVLWIDCDNGKRRTHERFEAMARARGLPADAPLQYVSMPNPRLDAGNGAQVGELLTKVKDCGAQLIIIDNLAKISGTRDENSNEMLEVTANLRYLAEETGACIIVIHHVRKSGVRDGERKGERLRGFGGIEGELDLAMLCTRDGDTVILSSTKERGADVPNIGAKFSHEKKLDGTLGLARFWGVGITDMTSIGEIAKVIKSNLGADALNQSELKGRVVSELSLHGVSAKRVMDVINILAGRGELRTHRAGKNAIIYSLPEDRGEDD
jgi:hypothetical protein